MKSLLLSLILVISSTAMADLSIECGKADRSKGVELDLASGNWYLRDSSISGLKKAVKLEPTAESEEATTFLYDYGSDYTKALYAFEGMNNCGVYESGTKVVTLTKSFKTFDGKIKNSEVQKCTCDED
jgi:hypothetical protein